MQTEVADSFKTIQDKLGETPSTFVFPEDKSTPETLKYVLGLHLVARDHESLFHTYNRLLIPVYGGKRFSIATGRLLIDIAMARRLWLIPQGHGLYSTLVKKSFKSISAELLKDQLNYLRENENKIWVARFIDAYKYLKERKETKINIEKSDKNEVTFSLMNNLNQTIYSYPLTVIINTAPVQPVRAYTVDKTNKKKIPIRIVGNKIFLEVSPSGQSIRVKWQ